MDNSINDKEWLDLAWKHFLQHAQQRILYFNYFVVFSTILTTGLITTFQNNYQAPFLGIGIGLIQIFLSFIFWKIDDRNKFLTQHAEDEIKEIELDYKSYCLFNNEGIKTKKLKEDEINKCRLFRQISHGKSYRIIFVTFFIVGLIGICISSINLIKKSSVISENQKLEILLKNNEAEIYSLKNAIIHQDSILIKDYKLILHKLDSVNTLLKSNLN